MRSVITDTFLYSNYAEAALWVIVAPLAFKAAWDRRHRLAAVVLAVTLVAFGVSDIVESTTGAWWRPWWLLAWKTLCVIVLVGTLATLWWTTRRSGPTSSDRPPAA